MVLGLEVYNTREFAEDMNSESMIPGIKLFGRKILAPERHFPADLHTTSEFPTDSQTSNVYGGDSKAENLDKSSSARTSQNPDPNKDSQEEKTLKKPDKILPCPRCNSFETKFCYFNNYNVNQPRHFCKNCQRYWTAGGTMRNVPIGAGRRKNKQFASQYHEPCLSINGGSPRNKIETSDTTNDVPSSEAKGTVLKFGPDSCLSESVESCSELTSTVSYDNYNPPLHHPLQHQQIPALFLPWNNNVASFQWCSSPMVSIPGPRNVPLQFVAAPCVGGLPLYTSGTGNVSLGLFNGGHCFPSSASNNRFSTLGKHSRDPTAADIAVLENSCLLPKVPKINGHSEASNSLSTTPLATGAIGCRWKGECSGSDSRGSPG